MSEFDEGSTELARNVALGKAVKPPIAELMQWPQILLWIKHSKSAGASRGHTYFMSDTPNWLINQLLHEYLRCSNPKCTIQFPAIRKHLNGRAFSIHVSGPGEAHKRCHGDEMTHKMTQWLYLVTKQQMMSPRIEVARQRARQGLIVPDDTGNEFKFL